jgi:hypothetical protein
LLGRSFFTRHRLVDFQYALVVGREDLAHPTSPSMPK